MRRIACELSGTALLLAVACGPVLAQDPNVREVSMVRQDFSDCPNGNVSDADPSRVGGTVVLARNTDGTTSVKVFITAEPNTKYNFFLKCVRSLGTLTTYDEGEAQAQFTFNTSEASNIFGFDMYPDGAPAGNKFQSVQVKF